MRGVSVRHHQIRSNDTAILHHDAASFSVFYGKTCHGLIELNLHPLALHQIAQSLSNRPRASHSEMHTKRPF